MDIDEARKLVEKKVPVSNRVVVKMDYTSFVLPYDDGLAIIKALQHAEMMDRQYNPTKIIPIEPAKMTFEILNNEDYVLLKMANLMGVDAQDLKKKED